MDSWRVAVLGDGGVGKTALAVQVRALICYHTSWSFMDAYLQFTLNCFVGMSFFVMFVRGGALHTKHFVHRGVSAYFICRLSHSKLVIDV